MTSERLIIFIDLLMAIVSLAGFCYAVREYRRLRRLSDVRLRKESGNVRSYYMEKYRMAHILPFKCEDIESLLEEISSILEAIYPECSFTISVMLVGKSDEENPLDSEVETLVSYPGSENNEDPACRIYIVKDNTDFSFIVDKRKKYFFVSGLEEYSVLKEYRNSDENFMSKYKSSIVMPIQKDKKIIGFLCIDSTGNLGNVKKNKKIVEVIESASSLLCDYLIENKLTKEAIIRKKRYRA